jgi:hypothetical protein
MTSANRRAQTAWTILWIPIFLTQFLVERTDSTVPWSIRIVAAILQAVAIVLPTILLAWLFRNSWKEWPRGSLILFAIYLFMLSTALHHVHSIRVLFNNDVPSSLYLFAYWSSLLLTSVIAPAALLLTLCVGTIANRSRWQALDLMTILVGVGITLLICVQNITAHPFDRINPVLSDVWHYVTCIFVPLALTVMAAIQWGLSRHRT